ncbi:MAG: SWIM zinc finger family protein [Planctomycetaceae bacterium]
MQCLLEPATRQWIDDLIRQHDERIARRGAEYVRRVAGWTYDEINRTVVCRVPGSGDEPYRVTLRLPVIDPIDFEHPPDGLDAVCTCPYSEGGRFLCKHTFAAATRLAELWDARPTAKIDRLLRGRAMPPGQTFTRESRNLRIDRRQTKSGRRRPRRPQDS